MLTFAHLVKKHGRDDDSETERGYSPRATVRSTVDRVTGRPDTAHVSTSYVERHNLTPVDGRPAVHAAEEPVALGYTPGDKWKYFEDRVSLLQAKISSMSFTTRSTMMGVRSLRASSKSSVRAALPRSSGVAGSTEILVEEQLHLPPTATSRCSRSAANVRQALMSSRVRSGKSWRRSSSDMPDAR